MPLLLCPNCNTSMSGVSRRGVEFDMCPSCRGVWLDRGELEKLIAADTDAPPQRTDYGRADHVRHDHDRRHWDDDHRHHKKKRFDLFDIFD